MEQHSKTPSSHPYPGTQAVLRAIHLLKAFSDARPELSLSELARSAHLKKTTAFRLLTALESEGMVLRNPDTETYRLGLEVLALAGRALRSNDLRSASRPELERLARETRETVTLEILVGDQVLILDEVFGGYLIGTAQWIGTRWPVHATSTGKVLLAYLPDERRQAILKKPLLRLTDKTITDPKVLEEELKAVRRTGYAVATEELEAGYTAVGAALRDHDGRVIAALSLGGPTTRMTPERIPEVASQVTESANRISAWLGFQPTN
jgi:IclR family acetate operon transcriptional repressor